MTVFASRWPQTAVLDGTVQGACRGRDHAAVGSASDSTCQTALHWRQRQTVIALRTVTRTSVEPQTGHFKQVSGMP
jgi:hypothetical protein